MAVASVLAEKWRTVCRVCRMLSCLGVVLRAAPRHALRLDSSNMLLYAMLIVNPGANSVWGAVEWPLNAELAVWLV